MANKILVIGDVANVFASLRKFTKTEIHIINFPKSGPGNFTYSNDYELFENSKVLCQIKKINEIKNKFDFCITMGTGEILAYLCNLNFVPFYVGRDIDAPRFIKNSKEDWYDEPLHKLNFLERRFYLNAFQSAVGHIGGRWIIKYLERYSNKIIRLDRTSIDTTIFNNEIEPLNLKKNKFTFFCPQRMGLGKGTDILWKALKHCKSDFEIIQVDWFDNTTIEEKTSSLLLKQHLPNQVKLIPMIEREKINSYYSWADGLIGNLQLGSFENVELESIFCGTPVICYNDTNVKLFVDKLEIKSPFLPISNDPEEIAKVIDSFVESKNFRDELLKKQIEFSKEISDMKKLANWWDIFFDQMVEKHKNIHRHSSKINIKFELFLFLLGNKMYFKKISNFLKRKIN